MPYLDCHDLETMLGCVSAAIGRTSNELVDALRAYDDATRPTHEDPWTFMPESALSSLGVEPDRVKFNGTHWFHGTRTLSPERFRSEGILPLPRVIDWLWDKLYGLIEDEVGREEWDAFRHSIEETGGGHYASLYRHKMRSPIDLGPIGELVREVILDPVGSGSHDYLGTPEIVEDIAIEAESAFGIDLAARFAKAAAPCVVKFRTRTYELGALYAALLYGHIRLTGPLVGRGACFAYSGEGVAIPAADVLDIEIIAE